MKKSLITGPTYLTLVRIVLSVVFLVFILLPDSWCRIVALIIFIVASITDYIDGRWARKQKIVTDLGAFLDPLADKMLVNLAFLALVYLGVVPLWMFAVILVRDFAVDGIRMMAARSNITVPASIYGKIKTTVQMFTLALLILNLIIDSKILGTTCTILLYLVVFLTVYSGVECIIKSWKRLIKS